MRLAVGDVREAAAVVGRPPPRVRADVVGAARVRDQADDDAVADPVGRDGEVGEQDVVEVDGVRGPGAGRGAVAPAVERVGRDRDGALGLVDAVDAPVERPWVRDDVELDLDDVPVPAAIVGPSKNVAPSKLIRRTPAAVMNRPGRFALVVTAAVVIAATDAGSTWTLIASG
jgi:hypothetical protein